MKVTTRKINYIIELPNTLQKRNSKDIFVKLARIRNETRGK